MVVFSFNASPRSILSPAQALELANIYLSHAQRTQDANVVMVLCNDTEVTLSHAKKTAKHAEVHTVRDEVAIAYIELGRVLDSHGKHDDAQTSYKKAEKLGGRIQKQMGRLVPYPDPNNNASHAKGTQNSTPNALDIKSSLSTGHLKQLSNAATIPKSIFAKDINPPAIVTKLPGTDERLSDTTQLVCCLGLLQAEVSPDDILDPAILEWIQAIENDQFEHERLKIVVKDVLRVFKRDEFKDAKAVAEAVHLAPVLEKDEFQYLLNELYKGIAKPGLLDVHQLEGLAMLIQGADLGHLDADNLVKILTLLSSRLRETHYQSSVHMYQLTMAISHVLDTMADTNVKGLDYDSLHEPLSSYLEELKSSSDPFLVYQAAYAYQALMHVPDNETLWKSALRRTGKVFKGVSGLIKAVKGFDLHGCLEALVDIQQGVSEVSGVIMKGYNTIEVAISAANSGKDLLDCLKEGLSFDQKRKWYSALRLSDTLLRNGQFATFKELVCEAPCRRDPAFLYGLCQQLGEVATDSTWDAKTRQSAIEFLGVIYRNDTIWGQQASVKKWIVMILMRLSLSSEKSVKPFAETLLQELESSANPQEQLLFQACREEYPSSYPLRIAPTSFASPSLLERAQNKPDVEGHLHQLMKQRLKEETKSVYISPQAKAGLQASDISRSPLMDKVNEFIESDQKVFLLLGDSGAGKSTFNRALECDLWKAYKKGGTIPLHINLPAIDKPDQDMIAKQLRRAEFTESQIRELKLHRKFFLICDGYDESQQTHNLYTTNRLNQPGEWQAKMVISCRTEYLGKDYLDRFQPCDRNTTLETNNLFQEAVITPFSIEQIDAYINQYVSIHQPLWEAKEYRQALKKIPSLKDLVRNPFLMSLSLEVLPRMMDPGQDFSVTRITKVALYDHFVDHWLERGKKRLGEKALSPQARAAFESLCDEGFTKNGIDFLKKLSVAIYRKQDGQPIVEYSRYKDEGSWKGEFFSREDRQLLREACPLTRNGNQYRFIHRSILEYGLTRAIHDPQEHKGKPTLKPSSDRRGSTSSIWSFENRGDIEGVASGDEQEPDINSPLAWRTFVNDLSLLQFLEERVRQEPLFKQQLLNYIEYSKRDKKWRVAAANAITILVRVGAEFRFADLQGIRIPGADLSGGVFESCNLQGADLRKTNLRSAWLRGANLSKSQMAGVQFGELRFLRYDSEVSSCMYSPDGESLAVGLNDGTISVYTTSNWEMSWIRQGFIKGVNSIAYSPSGDTIVSVSWDDSLHLWDVATGRCRQISPGFPEHVRNIAYSPQGDSIASCSDNGTVRIWDVETGECRHVLSNHINKVNKVLYSPKGNTIASYSDDGTIRLCDVATGACLYTLSGHTRNVTDIAFSPQGDLFASASEDKTVRIWNTETGSCRQVLSGHTDEVHCVTFSPRGNQLASSSLDRTVRLWSVEAAICIHTLSCHDTSPITYSLQGDMVASSGGDNTVQLWDSETGECRHTLTGHVKEVSKVLFPPRGGHLASASKDGTVRLWNIGAGNTRVVSSCHGEAVSSVKYSSKRHQIASCSRDQTIRLWDARTGACIHTLSGHKGDIPSTAYSPNEDRIISCSYDRTVRLWDVESGTCCHIFSGHSDRVNDVDFSPHGDQVASASDDKTIRLWDVGTGACQHVLVGHTKWVHIVKYSPRGGQVASGSWDGLVRLWNVETGECQHTLTAHTSGISTIMYSPNGKEIASGSWDGTARLWNVETGMRSHVVGFNGPYLKVAYSPQGDRVASGNQSGIVKLHDVKTGQCSHTLIGHKEPVESIAFSPSGNFIFTSHTNGEARLWGATTGECHGFFNYDGPTRVVEVKDRVAWIDSEVDSFVTGGRDRSVTVWEVTKEGGQTQVRLRWRSTTGRLTVEDTCIQDVEGLSDLDKRLLIQRGAVGEPTHRLCADSSDRLFAGSSGLQKEQREDPQQLET